MKNKYSIILPAKNEADNLIELLPVVEGAARDLDCEIIVINDGSADSTSEICARYSVKEVRHPYSKGNGAAIKTGSLAASGEILIFLDADGQHNPAEISSLVQRLEQGYDMVVGARRINSHASIWRFLANLIYNLLARYMTGQRVDDLTSGFRVVRATKFKEFLYLLPNGFSYPTTITMAFFRTGYSVAYEEITTSKRQGKSHVRPMKDGFRFFLIIFKVGTLYSPLKLFVPIAALFFGLGFVWYGMTYIQLGRFTNMSALLFTGGFIVFTIGLLSEQITALLYKR